MKRLLLLLVLAFFCVDTFAQTARNTTAPRVMEVNAYLASLRGYENAARSSASSADRLSSLLKDVQPAVYFYASEVKTYGEHPNSLFTNPASLSSVNASSIDRSNIEVVTITIKTAADLNRNIDLSVFSNFPNLKYIYILSTIETTESTISNAIRNNDSRYAVFYKIDKGA